jgi:hypothetical protein
MHATLAESTHTHTQPRTPAKNTAAVGFMTSRCAKYTCMGDQDESERGPLRRERAQQKTRYTALLGGPVE